MRTRLAETYFATTQEVQKYLSWTNHMWDGFWLFANRHMLDALPATVQDVVAKSINEAALRERGDVEKLNDELKSKLGKSLEFVDVDPSLFRQKLQASTFYSDWEGRFGPEAWALLESFSGKLAWRSDSAKFRSVAWMQREVRNPDTAVP